MRITKNEDIDKELHEIANITNYVMTISEHRKKLLNCAIFFEAEPTITQKYKIIDILEDYYNVKLDGKRFGKRLGIWNTRYYSGFSTKGKKFKFNKVLGTY